MKYFQKNVDFTKILNKSHEGKWVALSSDRTKVLDYSASLLELRDKIKDAQGAVYMKVLPSDTLLAF